MTDFQMVTRRSFLGCVSASYLFATQGLNSLAASGLSGSYAGDSYQLIDTHVYLFHWPFRRVPNDEPAQLVDHLKKHGVTAAWAGSLEALFHRDIASVNGRLWEECRKVGHGFLVPCGTINPALPDWTEDFRRCVDEFQMPILRLFPGYHGYSLDVPEVGRLFDLATERRVKLQVVIEMEDIRAQNPLLTVKPVDVSPLFHWLKEFPSLQVMLLNCHRAVPSQQLEKLVGAGPVYVDLGMLEGMAGLERLASVIPDMRICFGSFSPVFYFHSAMLKLLESRLDDPTVEAICFRSAQEFLGVAHGGPES